MRPKVRLNWCDNDMASNCKIKFLRSKLAMKVRYSQRDYTFDKAFSWNLTSHPNTSF